MISDILKNFNVFVDGRGFAGQADEVQLPKLNLKTEEHRAAGMDAPVEIDMGMEKLEAEMSFTSFDLQLLGLWGIMPGAMIGFTVRGALQSENGVVKPLIINMRGNVKMEDMGTMKAGEKGQLKLGLAIRYYKVTHTGIPVCEIDIENYVRMVNGVDQLAGMRLALGR